MPSNLDEKSVRVDSPVRFAVIGPGKPYPAVIIATDQGVSDLVGYYSLRELGMQKLLEQEGSSEGHFFPELFRFAKSSDRESQAPIGSIDIWTNQSSDLAASDREKLFSLVVQSNAVQDGQLIVPQEVQKGLENQLRSIANAYKTEDIDAVRYAGQILTTILGLIEKQTTLRFERRVNFARALFVPIALITALMAIVAGFTPIILALIHKSLIVQ
jgi:hypothetical protein